MSDLMVLLVTPDEGVYRTYLEQTGYGPHQARRIRVPSDLLGVAGGTAIKLFDYPNWWSEEQIEEFETHAAVLEAVGKKESIHG